MAVQIPMKIVHVAYKDLIHIFGEYAYRNDKGWVKWGHTYNLLRRGSQHRTTLGAFPQFICVMENATEAHDRLIKATLPCRVPMTDEWFYDLDPMWEEAKRLARSLKLGFIRLKFEPYLPLFDGNGFDGEPPI